MTLNDSVDEGFLLYIYVYTSLYLYKLHYPKARLCIEMPLDITMQYYQLVVHSCVNQIKPTAYIALGQ